ncbi:hypothetical protein CSOJ01_01000 [Colletotrichum sojae]|uniref:Uncharacterized protein n=1 Tax=Colletotrichum sojae TaxID=2175907 RepID=A0A8H6N4D0_9PEZI|nr:hypothetical protein CSOJ01_01000 [Colletotrichum sojae]
MPPLSPVPQDQPLADGQVIQPQDMRAITVDKDTKVIAKDLQGNRIESAVNKGRIGYEICDAPGMPGYVLCQLLNIAMRQSDFDVGELHGLRVERPPREEAESTRREWLRYQVVTEGRSMSVFRTRSHVVLAKGHARFVVMFPTTSGVKWKLEHILDELSPAPPVGSPVVVSLHAMDDGKPHPRPWYRGPLRGAWDNSHELHSFSVTVECLHASWGGDLSFNKSWIMATRMLQFIHNRRYKNPPPFLAESVNAEVKDVVWNHMTQAVRFTPRTKPRPEGFRWKCAVCASLADVHLSVGDGKAISWEAIKPSELEPEEMPSYQPPRTRSLHGLARQPSTYMYTLPSHPGLLPTLHQRPQAIELPAALPEFESYNLKGELDTDADEAGEENDEGEDRFGGVA